MTDYRDDHSPDIALLLTLARAVRETLVALGGTPAYIKAIDDGMKPFEHYPDPVETEETGA